MKRNMLVVIKLSSLFFIVKTVDIFIKVKTSMTLITALCV